MKDANNIIWVVFLGAPSTGKSTLCKKLAQHYNTVYMPEYGRDYWLEHQEDRRLSPEQLVEIAEGHIQEENRLVKSANQYFFIDTDATTTWMFAQYYHQSAAPELDQMADQARDRYDLFFLCDDDIPYEDTWDRSGKVFRGQFQKDTRADLDRRGIPYQLLSGSLEQRFEAVCSALASVNRNDDELTPQPVG